MKLKKLLAIPLMMVFLAGCTHTPKIGTYGDAVSTYINLSNGHGELNPVFSWANDPLAIALLSIGVKQGGKYALTPIMGECHADRTIEGAGMIGLGWNIGTFLTNAYPPAIILGAISGAIYYNSVECPPIGGKE